MLRGVTPGLGFSHLAAGRASGARGVPRGEASDSAEACRDQCDVNERCGAWSFKPKERKCFLGNCTGVYSPCFEAVPANPPPMGGISRPSPHALSCGATARTRGSGRGGAGAGRSAARGGGGAGRGEGKDGRLNRRRALQAGGATGRRAQAAGSGRRLALLVLGHRARLMFDTLPGTLVAPLVAGGTEVRFFAWLENSSMAAAFRGRRHSSRIHVAGERENDVVVRGGALALAAAGDIADGVMRGCVNPVSESALSHEISSMSMDPGYADCVMS